ncbi:MAG: tRNA (adenosine(37)-N6)-threonylcarbamoyltransferase complex dimerization subunit type 1 TsaB [Planctomycetaceae bacterium]|nr:tRNA (adenosine(37)-N6)-threonylcarbamoyltransferase complex dimerization subunit type 1 TsaB [Planctomycetaceae bacterium]
MNDSGPDRPGVEHPLLALELSQRSGGAAVVDEHGGFREIGFQGGRRDRDDVLPGIHEVLAGAGVAATSLGTVAVNVGPGGFTGLRISIAAGQAIAEVAGAIVVGVPGALVAAEATPEVRAIVGEIAVLSAAKAGTAWRTRLGRTATGDPWRVIGDPGIVDRLDDLPCDALLADEHVPEELVRSAIGDPPTHPPRFDASSVARVALGSDVDLVVDADPARLLPIYPREPEAVRKWRSRPDR